MFLQILNHNTSDILKKCIATYHDIGIISPYWPALTERMRDDCDQIYEPITI